MPGYVIHLAIGKEYAKKNKMTKEEEELLRGCIMPDLLEKPASHYGKSSSNPDLKKYLENNRIDNAYNKGYLLHLVSDYLFYNKYLNRFIEEFSDEIYHDYNKLNKFLIEKYGIEIPKEIESIVKFEDGEPAILDKKSICEFIDAISEIDFTQLKLLKQYLEEYEIQ